MGTFKSQDRVGNWKLVYITNTQIEAEHFKANLEGAEIPVQVLSQFDTSRGITVGGFAVVKIYVPEEFFDEAKKIIEDIESNSGEELEHERT